MLVYDKTHSEDPYRWCALSAKHPHPHLPTKGKDGEREKEGEKEEDSVVENLVFDEQHRASK